MNGKSPTRHSSSTTEKIMQTFRSESGLVSIMKYDGSVTIRFGEEIVGSFKAVPPSIWWADRVNSVAGGRRSYSVAGGRRRYSFMGEDFGWVCIAIGGTEAPRKELKSQKPVEESPSILPSQVEDHLLEIRCNRSKHWRLLEGALVADSSGLPARVLKVEGNRVLLCTELEMVWADNTPSHYSPVLTDPGTRGCLLERVREVKEDPAIHIRPIRGGKWWRSIDEGENCTDGWVDIRFRSEADALVWLLETAE